MKFHILLLVAVVAIVVIFKYFTVKKFNKDLNYDDPKNSNHKKYDLTILNDLHNINNFLHSAINHIFVGTINIHGEADGYHYDNIKNTNSTIISNTKTTLNKYDVYKAKVIVNRKYKSDDGGYSTFFPNNHSPQDVINSINEAYSNKHHIDGNIYIGRANNGMEIEMYLTDDYKIISAFPKY
ncbi:MAG: EndoU domain-containing protein [Sarcina sp.]